MSGHRCARRITQGALCLLAAAALVLGALTLVPAACGYRTYAVRSPSMAPQIPLGSLVIVDGRAQAIHVQPGDVTAFRIGETDESVCVHRAISIDQEGGLIETKGDANAVPDLRLVPFEDVAGIVCAQVPLAGFALIWAESMRPAIIALAAMLALASMALSLTSPREHRTEECKGREKGTGCQNRRKRSLREA